MTRTTNISWAEKTWNPITGCTKVSPGCKHCYAETMAQRIVRMGQKSSTRYLPVVRDGRWTGTVQVWPELLDGPGTPLRVRTPTTWFVGSMSDVFQCGVPFEFLAAMFAVMAACPQHRFMLLTKRPSMAALFMEGMRYYEPNDSVQLRRFLSASFANATAPDDDAVWAAAERLVWRRMPAMLPWPLPSVAIGTSAETQEYADERIPVLREIPAHRRFVSFEPLLGPIEIADWSGIDLAILGCESGKNRREANLEWIQDLGRSVLDAQVRAVVGQAALLIAGTALHIKQADVCPECAGAPGPCGTCPHMDATERDSLTGKTVASGAHNGTHTGRAGKVRGKDPSEDLRIYIPGHGTRAWREEIQW